MTNKLILTLVLTLTSSLAFAAEHTVEMKNMGTDGMMVFEPAVINVAVGDTVNFEPTDSAHNSESVPGLTPKGSVTWKGEMSQKISVTIDKEGVYIYKCMPHSVLAMVGVIIAGKPTNLDEIKKSSKALTTTFATNNDRLNKYLSQVK